MIGPTSAAIDVCWKRDTLYEDKRYAAPGCATKDIDAGTARPRRARCRPSDVKRRRLTATRNLDLQACSSRGWLVFKYRYGRGALAAFTY